VADVLTRFQTVAAAGDIYGPWPNGSHVWEARGAAAVQVMILIWPWLGEVKREQFRAAIARYNDAARTPRAMRTQYVAPSSRTCSTTHLIAWAAGLFDGDGSTTNSVRRLKGEVVSAGIKASVSQSGPEGIPEVLERFASAVGFGAIYGPVRWRNATEPGFEWTVQAYRDVRRLREAIGPFVGPVKAAQLDGALATFEASPHRRLSAFGLSRRPLAARRPDLPAN